MEIQQFCILIVFTSSVILLLATTTQTDTDFSDLVSGKQRQGRWGMFFSYEPICTKACRKNGKFSGRMFGGVCRCYCPRIETDPCKGLYPSCDRLCRQHSYHLGGDCIDEKTCFCFCTVRQRQSANSTVTSTTMAPCATSSSQAPTPPAQAPVPVVPSPGSLGLQGG